MNLFWVVALFATIPDLLTIADAVADWTRPGRHLVRGRAGHGTLRVR